MFRTKFAIGTNPYDIINIKKNLIYNIYNTSIKYQFCNITLLPLYTNDINPNNMKIHYQTSNTKELKLSTVLNVVNIYSHKIECAKYMQFV